MKKTLNKSGLNIMSYKQSWHRTNKQDFRKYQNSKIWDNLSKKDKNKIIEKFKNTRMNNGLRTTNRRNRGRLQDCS